VLDTIKVDRAGSDKHSTFSTTFPIYIMERKSSPGKAAPTSIPADGDPDEFDDDIYNDEQSPADDIDTTLEEWVRVNDKAPIWMRWVHRTKCTE
jgi:heat shock protein beta